MPCWKGCTTWKGGRRIHWSFSNAPFQCFNDYWTEKNWSVFFFPSFFCPAKANLKGCHSRSTLEANSLICHTSIAALSVFFTHTQTHMPSGYLSLCLEVVVLLHVFEVQPVFWEIHLFTILPRSISISPSVQSYLHRFQMYNWSHISVQIQTSHVFTVSSFFSFLFRFDIDHFCSCTCLFFLFFFGFATLCLPNLLFHLVLPVTACKCNGHASVCQVLTGKCFCTTKGIKGDQCQLWVYWSLLALSHSLIQILFLKFNNGRCTDCFHHFPLCV